MRIRRAWLSSLLTIGLCLSAQAGTVFTLSTPDPEVAAISIAAENFADMVASLTNNAITVDVHPEGQLFSHDPGRALGMLGSGSMDMLLLSASLYANKQPHFIALSFPYLFENMEQFDQFLGSPVADQLKKDVAGMNIHVINFWPRSFRVLTNSKHPVTSIDDMAGLRLRVPNNPLWMEFFRSLGASPTPILFNEVYQALKNKVVDGQENPISIAMDAKFYEVQKYITFTNHIADAWVLGINMDVWQALTPDQRLALTEAAENARRNKMEKEIAGAQRTIEFLQLKGMEVHHLAPAERARFAATARRLYPRFAELVGDDAFVEQVLRFAGVAQ